MINNFSIDKPVKPCYNQERLTSITLIKIGVKMNIKKDDFHEYQSFIFKPDAGQETNQGLFFQQEQPKTFKDSFCFTNEHLKPLKCTFGMWSNNHNPAKETSFIVNTQTNNINPLSPSELEKTLHNHSAIEPKKTRQNKEGFRKDRLTMKERIEVLDIIIGWAGKCYKAISILHLLF